MPIEIEKLESHLWEAANILRGPVDAADFKTYVFPRPSREPGFSSVASLSDIRSRDANLSIPLYVASAPTAQQERAGYEANGLDRALADWLDSSRKVRASLNELLSTRKG